MNDLAGFQMTPSTPICTSSENQKQTLLCSLGLLLARWALANPIGSDSRCGQERLRVWLRSPSLCHPSPVCLSLFLKMECSVSPLSKAFLGFAKVSLVLLQRVKVRSMGTRASGALPASLPILFFSVIMPNFVHYIASEDRISLIKQKFENNCLSPAV